MIKCESVGYWPEDMRLKLIGCGIEWFSNMKRPLLLFKKLKKEGKSTRKRRVVRANHESIEGPHRKQSKLLHIDQAFSSLHVHSHSDLSNFFKNFISIIIRISKLLKCKALRESSLSKKNKDTWELGIQGLWISVHKSKEMHPWNT